MSAPLLLGPWANFYLMIGPAAASLTGLMFVVITLVVNANRERRSGEGIATFSTPTVAHFAGVLIISAVMVAPWHVVSYPAIIFSAAGLIGTIYVSVLIARTVRMTLYQADVEDWIWYNVVPLLSYLLVLAGGLLLLGHSSTGPFMIAAASVLFVAAGIHNAWDIIVYLTVARDEEQEPN
jgi:hypothetical protein